MVFSDNNFTLLSPSLNVRSYYVGGIRPTFFTSFSKRVLLHSNLKVKDFCLYKCLYKLIILFMVGTKTLELEANCKSEMDLSFRLCLRFSSNEEGDSVLITACSESMAK